MRLICLILLLLSTVPAYANEYHRAAVDPTPSKIPDRIILNWSGDPTTTASITWRTDTSITQAEGQIAEANASANFTTWARSENARTEKWKHYRKVAHFHSVTFKSLKPNTLYAYRVGSGDIWSSWYQFRTASAEPDAFTFIYLGDAQNNLLALWARTIRTAVLDAPHADFIIHAGDLVDHPNKDSDWHEWFESGDWIHAKIPSVPTPGNNEYSNYQDAEQTPSICSMASAIHPARKWAPGLCGNHLLHRLSGCAHHLASIPMNATKNRLPGWNKCSKTTPINGLLSHSITPSIPHPLAAPIKTSAKPGNPSLTNTPSIWYFKVTTIRMPEDTISAAV